MNDDLASAVADFLAHKRAIGRKYLTEEATLRLLLCRSAVAATDLVAHTQGHEPDLLDEDDTDG